MEAPELDRFYRDNKERAEVLAIADDTEDAMRDFMTAGGWVFPVMLDVDDVGNDYGVRFIPTLVVIDREGKIAEKIVGGVTASDLTALVDGLSN